ncbi:glycosyltransferase family 2 protein [Candidatus Roizmanbacteria bacterium]|nr:glycosyltransferase family 2 protein [Candidatus Roizmanbacteria bacterium]
MKIIIPLAGRGLRFRKKGFTLPKPLISVAGRPMIEWPILSIKRMFPKIKSQDFIFITLAQYEQSHKISAFLKTIAGNECTVKLIKKVTEGPVCTVLTAADLINTDEDMLTCDCDQYFICPEFFDQRNKAIKSDWGGLIPIYESANPAYSYVKLDTQGNALQTAEKQVISSHAAIGLYYFTKGSHFVSAAKDMIRRNLRYNNEFYMCPLYNYLIQNGSIIRTVKTKIWTTIGTPDEANNFEKNLSNYLFSKT